MKIEIEIPEGYELESFTVRPKPVLQWNPTPWVPLNPVYPPMTPVPYTPPFGGATCSSGEPNAG